MNVACTGLFSFALFEASGILYFSGFTPDNFFKAVAIICALIISSKPKKLIKPDDDKGLLLFFCVTGVCASLVVIYQDFQWENGPNSGLIMLRLLFVTAFFFEGFRLFKEPRKTDS